MLNSLSQQIRACIQHAEPRSNATKASHGTSSIWSGGVSRGRSRMGNSQGEEGVMPQYRVVFYNNLLNSNGLLFKCTQRSVPVGKAKDAEEASEKAKREFEQL